MPWKKLVPDSASGGAIWPPIMNEGMREGERESREIASIHPSVGHQVARARAIAYTAFHKIATIASQSLSPREFQSAAR